MSHVTTVTGVSIIDKAAFIEAMRELGFTNIKENSLIKIYDGRHIQGEVSCTVSDPSRGKEYSLGLVKGPDGKYQLVGDFMCVGWVLPQKFRDALKGKGITDKAIQDMVMRGTTKHTLQRIAAKKGMRTRVVEGEDGTLRMTVSQ